MIPIVIVQIPQHAKKVTRFVNYCKRLDGTEILVLTETKHAHLPPLEGAQHCFELATRELRHTAFFWIEADAIPLRSGWKAPIVQQWRESGKDFLLPDLTGLHVADVASGIGIYPKGVADMVPQGLGYPCLWDLWIYRHLADKIHYTNLIQHSYAYYVNPYHLYRRWHFPEDQSVIKPEALIFHSDPYQSLITPKDETFEHAYFAYKHSLPPPPARAKRNLSTSAGNQQKNLSTSAELFQ